MFENSENNRGNGLKVEDADFMWSKLIGDTPTDKVIREIFQNTTENEGTNKVVCGEMSIDGFEGKKFYMINNGKGIDNIKKLENLFGSEKNPSRHLKGNNNTGVRLMGAAANKLGIAFITKYNNNISAFFMCRPREDSYNVETYFLDENFNPYNLMKDYGRDFNIDGDWTMVICLGETSEQNTFRQPDYKNEYSSKDFVEQFIVNRYYERPTTLRKGKEYIDLIVGNKSIKFLEEELKEIDGKDFIFETNIAKYVIKFSETFGNLVPKCAIVFDNEMFDVRADGYYIKNIVGDSKNFLTNIGAYNLRSKLSILVFPNDNLLTRMDNYRTNLIVESNNFHKGTLRLTLNDFVKDFVENSPENLKELIKNSNPNHVSKISQKNIDRLLKALNGRYRDSKGMTFKKEKKSLSSIVKEQKEKEDSEMYYNQYFEDLIKKFTLVKYNLLNESIRLNLDSNLLRNKLENYMKLIKSNMKNIVKEKDENVMQTLLTLYSLSIEYNTISIKNVLIDMIELNDESLKNNELLIAYQMVLKLFIDELKKDINDKNKDSDDDNNESDKSKNEITPLEVFIKTKEDWNEDHKNLSNKDKTYALYTDRIVIINEGNEIYQDIKNEMKNICLENNISEKIVDEVFANTISLFGGFLTTFKIITKEDNLNLEIDDIFNHQLEQSGEIFSSHSFSIEQMIFEELENNISDIKGITKA